ncbi:Protein SEY1 [Galdieria sulphuraria]|nr:Protein SEY1 [Galdieria sulphuraria]
MAGLSIHLYTDREIAQVLESQCGIKRLLDFFQVEDLSYLTEKTGIPLERWKLVHQQILLHFGCNWKTASELETHHPSLASVGQVETCVGHILEYIKSTVIVEVAGRSNCGKSELLYQIGLFAISYMPVYLFTTSKRAACARLATLRRWIGPESTELYEHFYIDECIDFYRLCNSLESLESCLEHSAATDINSIACNALILLDGLHIAQMLSLDCTFHERMSWIELFTLLLKRIAFKYRCSIVVTNTLDRRDDDSTKYQSQELEMKRYLTILNNSGSSSPYEGDEHIESRVSNHIFHVEAAHGVPIVTSQGNFVAEQINSLLSEAVEEWPSQASEGISAEEAREFAVISAIGVKGCGKTTFFNHLFGTHLQVSSPLKRSEQEKDTEGTDGRTSQAANNKRLERIVTLTVAVSDVILYHVWLADLGRFEAAGYGVFYTVLGEHLKIFQRDHPSKTLILFVVHDHDDGSTLEHLKKLILTDMEHIWDNVEKPNDYKTAKLSEFFDIQVVSLPHPRYRREEYEGSVAAIRDRFLGHFRRSEDYFLKREYSKELPLESFATYAEVVWSELTRSDAESGSHVISSGIPSQRELLATYQCDLSYETQLQNAMEKCQRWQNDTSRGKLIDKFGHKASSLYTEAMDNYDTSTAPYSSFQIALLQQQGLNKFKDMLLSAVAANGSISEYDQHVAMRRVDDWFIKKAEELVVPSLRLHYRLYRLEMQNALNETASKFRDSPTVQMQAMQKLEKLASRPPPKQRGVVVGVGLNAAIRPSGYGNLQMLASYNKGPHSLNVSLVNDRDVAQQEGQSDIALFRIQPTLHFDIDI